MKKDLYYELVDAATFIAYSKREVDVNQRAAEFNTLYFGRAHIFVVDRNVMKAKVAFYSELENAVESDAIWSEDTSVIRWLSDYLYLDILNR